MADKKAVDHDEDVVVQQDLDMTAWQCLKANPKIVLWTLYANSRSSPPNETSSTFTCLFHSSRLNHGGVREPRIVRVPRDARFPVSPTIPLSHRRYPYEIPPFAECASPSTSTASSSSPRTGSPSGARCTTSPPWLAQSPPASSRTASAAAPSSSPPRPSPPPGSHSALSPRRPLSSSAARSSPGTRWG